LKIAVFSDIHGNPYACRAVLQAITHEGPWDAILAAGDLCLGGSDPAGCIDLLWEAGVIGVYGNTEAYIKSPEQAPPDELHRKRWYLIQPAAYWVRAQLSTAQMAWLEALPFELRFSPSGRINDDLLVVHANPKDVELMIYPQEAEQIRLWGEVRQPDDDPALVRAMEGVTASVVVFGHYHRPNSVMNHRLKCCLVQPEQHDNDYRALWCADLADR
jgi:predicted phosphodiesterase